MPANEFITLDTYVVDPTFGGWLPDHPIVIVDNPYERNQNEFLDFIKENANAVYTTMPTLSIKKVRKETSTIKGIRCSFCGENADKTIILDNHKVCAKCYEKYTKLCSGGCGVRLTNNDFRNDYSTKYYIYRTACPKDWVDRTNHGETDPFKCKWFCTECIKKPEVAIIVNAAWTCLSCGQSYVVDVEHAFKDTRGRKKCGVCQESTIIRMRRELAYNANVLEFIEAFTPPNSMLQFGIELEVQIPSAGNINTKIEMIRELLPTFAICKHDGSLLLREGWTGFEIVSVPATVAEHKEYWPKLLDTKHGLVSWKTGDCGMHVHISKAALTTLQIGKMLNFVNSPDNAALINLVAGRYSSKYTTILDKKITDVTARPTGDHNYDRRQALNLINPNTVELRIFRGNLKPESFFKNLEFTDALVAFCRNAGNTQLTTEFFKKFVGNNSKDYPYLVRFFVKNKYLESNERPSQKIMPIHTECLARRREALEKENSYIYDCI